MFINIFNTITADYAVKQYAMVSQQQQKLKFFWEAKGGCVMKFCVSGVENKCSQYAMYVLYVAKWPLHNFLFVSLMHVQHKRRTKILR